jgi:hypothetical protein
MLNVNEFFLATTSILSVCIVLITLLRSSKLGRNLVSLSNRIVVIPVFMGIIILYVLASDLNSFPDVEIYSKLESSEQFVNSNREVLFSFFLDKILPSIPKYSGLSGIFIASVLIFAAYLATADVNLYKISFFMLGPGFAIIFMQYRTFLALSIFLLMSNICQGKFRWLKYMSIGVHISLVASFFTERFRNLLVRKNIPIISSLILFSLVYVGCAISVYPMVSDYVPKISAVSIGFFVFCWVYILFLSDLIDAEYIKTIKRKPQKFIRANHIGFMILITLFSPYIALSTRFFAVHASIYLLKTSLYETNKQKRILKELILAMLICLPTFVFFFLLPPED